MQTEHSREGEKLLVRGRDLAKNQVWVLDIFDTKISAGVMKL